MLREKKQTPTNISEGRTRRKTAVVTEPPDAGTTKMNGELEAAIRARAYAIYEERGRVDGQDQDDWVRAEREVLAHMGKRSA